MGFFNSVKNIFKSKQNDLNPNFEEFAQLSSDDEEALRKSVIDQYFKGDNTGSYQTFGYDYSRSYSEFVYGAVNTSKVQRLNAYRKMGNFPEVSNAIDEICDSMANYNENEEIVSLKIKNPKINEIKSSEIKEEFNNYIALFDFDQNFFDYARTVIIDGELAFENIIDSDNPSNGIIGINLLPTESFDFLIDPITCKKRGILVKIDLLSPDNTFMDIGSGTNPTAACSSNSVSSGPQNNKQANKDDILDANTNFSDEEGIPLPWDQITYIDSGSYNPSKLIVYPVLEKARKAYRQLSLIEDAVIIYRLVRAPERLVFNVYTGKLNKSKSEQEVYKMMKRFQTKKFYNPVTGSVSNDYDPHAILENFWFPKPEGSDGTTVESIAGTSANFTELPDLEYFQKKLWLALKVPKSRFIDTQVNIEKADTINPEEYRFAKFIMRLQNRFAIGLYKGFITHLKLRGLWDMYELNETDMRVVLTPPSSYDLYEKQRLLQIKFANYDTVTDNHQEISKELAMMKYLDYSEDDIRKNRKWKESEEMWLASLEYKTNKIKETGNPFTVEENE